MEAVRAFWRKKSVSNPNSPDSNTRRVIPTLTFEEWKNLPSTARGYLIRLGTRGGFEEVDFPITSFEYKSNPQLNVQPPYLTVTRVSITIASEDKKTPPKVHYCYLYKKIGQMLLKFIMLEDWFQYFEGWDYVGLQTYEKRPDNDDVNDVQDDDDDEVSFRPPIGYQFPNREDFGDEPLEETVLHQNETHDPFGIAQNSNSSVDGIPSAQACNTVLTTPAGPVRIEVLSNTAYYESKHNQEASEQQDLAAIRNHAQPSTSGLMAGRNTPQPHHSTGHSAQARPVPSTSHEPNVDFLSHFNWGPGEWPAFRERLLNAPSEVVQLLLENSATRRMFRSPSRPDNDNRRPSSRARHIHTETDDYSDVSEQDEEALQRTTQRSSAHSPTKRRRATQGRSTATVTNSLTGHNQATGNTTYPRVPINRQAASHNSPMLNQTTFVRGLATSHSTPQIPPNIVQQDDLQSHRARPTPVLNQSHHPRRFESHITGNMPRQPAAPTYNGQLQPVRLTQVPQVTPSTLIQQSAYPQQNVSTNFLPRSVPTSISYNTHLPVVSAPPMSLSQPTTSGALHDLTSILRDRGTQVSSASLQRPQPVYPQIPVQSAQSLFQQLPGVTSVPWTHQHQQAPAVVSSIQVQQPPHVPTPPVPQQQAPISHTCPPASASGSNGEASSMDSLTRDYHLKAVLSRLPHDFIKFSGTGVSINDWLLRVAQYVDPIENEDSRKCALLALIKPGATGTLTRDGWSGSYASLIDFLKTTFQHTNTEFSLSEWALITRHRTCTISEWMCQNSRLMSNTASSWATYTDEELKVILRGLQNLAPPLALKDYVEGNVYKLSAFRSVGLFGALAALISHQTLHDVAWTHFDNNKLKQGSTRACTIQNIQDTTQVVPSTSGTSGRSNRQRRGRGTWRLGTGDKSRTTTGSMPVAQDPQTEHTQQNQQRASKYCLYHKRYGHSSSECRALKAQNDPVSHNPQSRPPQPQRQQNYAPAQRQDQTNRPSGSTQDNTRPYTYQRSGQQRSPTRRDNTAQRYDNRPAQPPVQGQNQSHDRRGQGRWRQNGNSYNNQQRNRRAVNNIDDQQQNQQQHGSNHRAQQPTQQAHQGNYSLPGHDAVGLGIINTR